MTHEISTLSLVGSKAWDLLLQQLKQAKRQGISPDNLYHMLDRLPGHVRKELHEFFRKEGDTIENPLFKQHINPMDAMNEYFSGDSEPLDKKEEHYPLVNRKPDDAGLITRKPIDDDLDPEIRRDFARRFNQAPGMDLFAQSFMSPSDNGEQTNVQICETESDLFPPDSAASVAGNPSGVSMSPLNSESALNRFDQLRESLDIK